VEWNEQYLLINYFKKNINDPFQNEYFLKRPIPELLSSKIKAALLAQLPNDYKTIVTNVRRPEDEKNNIKEEWKEWEIYKNDPHKRNLALMESLARFCEINTPKIDKVKEIIQAIKSNISMMTSDPLEQKHLLKKYLNSATEYNDLDVWTTAVIKGHNEIAATLQEEGVEFNEKNTKESMILLLVRSKRKDILNFLLTESKDSRIEKKSIDDKLFALLEKIKIDHSDFIESLEWIIWLAKNNDLEMFKFVMSKLSDREKAAVREFKNFDGNTPLMIALQNEGVDKNFVEFLIDNGFNVGATNHLAQTPLIHAVQLEESEKNIAILELLIKTALKDAKNAQDIINASDANGDTALMHAVKTDNFLYIIELVNNGAKINFPNHQTGETPFLKLLSMGNMSESLVKYFLQKKADINTPNIKTGETPLIVALKSNKKEDFIDFLINQGANINAADHDRKSVLMYMAEFTSPSFFEYIIMKIAEEKIDMTARDNSGKTLIMYVVQGFKDTEDNAAIIDLLMKIMNKKAEDAKTIIDSMNVTDTNGNTALIDAIKNNKFYFVEALLPNGADLNVPNSKTGETPLMIALSSEEVGTDIVRLLIKKGADINAKDKYGRTPLMAAIESNNLKKVETLLSMSQKIGVSLDFKKEDIEQKTVWDYAKEKNINKDILDVLENFAEENKKMIASKKYFTPSENHTLTFVQSAQPPPTPFEKTKNPDPDPDPDPDPPPPPPPDPPPSSQPKNKI
jgi:ankyrin repeat protein